MPKVKITKEMRLKENSGYLKATLRVNRYYESKPIHLADTRLTETGMTFNVVKSDSFFSEQFFWKNLTQLPLPERNNVIGVIINVDSSSRDQILTHKLLISQPNNQYILLIIQSDSAEYGNNIFKI